MKLVKVSTPWDHTDYNSRISSMNPPGDYKFIFNNEQEKVDYWIIWGGIKGDKESAVCNRENVIYLTDEVHEQRFFNKNFLDQFSAIVTCRTDLGKEKIIPTHELNTWLLDKDFDWLYRDNDLPKTKTLSAITSDQTWLPGHKLRYAFINRMIGHFKDRLDVFGKGFNPVKDKFDALAPYKYSIAIENSIIPGYFTEKIADCYLAHTMPVYYGSPDIDSYFDPVSILFIDPNDYRSSIRKIEQLIEEDPYEKILPLLINEKKKYLDQYHIFSKILKIIDNMVSSSGEKVQHITIKNERCFQRGYKLNTAISMLYKKLHIPGRFYFSVHLDQSSTYINKK